MNKREETKAAIKRQVQQYPELQPADVFKFLYQSSYGCEHLVSDVASVKAYIESEAMGSRPRKNALVEPLDGAYCRVDLEYLNRGLSVDTFAKLFVISAEPVKNGRAVLEEKLSVMMEMTDEGELPFSKEMLVRDMEKWRDEGYPACRHSEHFRETYFPAYRLMKEEYVMFLPLFCAIDTLLAEGTVNLAIEGGSGSGKTTLATLLNRVYGGVVMHMDDFFLRPEQRTPERFAEPGGNVDRERFWAEVLQPLGRKEPIVYRPFDCGTFALGEAVTVLPARFNVIEGAYSMHPELRAHYDLSVFLDISQERQKERIAKRNTPEMVKRFLEEWIPMEQRYFEALNIKEQCDMVITVS